MDKLFKSLVACILLNTSIAWAQPLRNDISLSKTYTYEWPKEPEVIEKLQNWMDLKFGVIFHWGIYSQPGITESWNLCNEDWVPKDTTLSYHEYKEWYWNLADQFNPTNFNPQQWVDVTKEAGMKYMIFTTKHHDGFCMYNTKYTDYSITKHAFANNPKSDVWKYVQEAFRNNGFMTGAYFSKPDWHSQYFWWNVYATKDRYPSYNIEKYPWRWEQFKKFTYGQIEELVTNYENTDILWLDGGWVRADLGFDIDLPKIAEMARKHQPGMLIVDRHSYTPYENYKTPEQSIPDEPLGYPWESCITLSNMWGYGKHVKWKSPQEIINMLIEIVAKGGNLLLGIGPTPEGIIQEEAVERLRIIGDWLNKNGKAIYNTRTAHIYKDGNVCFTTSKDSTVLNAIYMLEEGKELPKEISWNGNLPSNPDSVKLLSTGQYLPCQIEGQHVTVTIPEDLDNLSFAIQYPTYELKTPVFKILAIGNSFSEDAVEQNLYELAQESGIELIIGNAYRAGQGFESHWNDVVSNNNTFEFRKIEKGTKTSTIDQSLASIIANEPWDYITFQQVSQESGMASTFEPYLGNLIDYVKSLSTNPEVKYGYHMTWAYAQNSTHPGFANYDNEQMTMYEAILSAVQKAFSDHEELSFVIPCGTAIQNARTSFIGDSLNRDGYHLNFSTGRYTAACTWLESILGINPVGKTYIPSGVDETTAFVCQKAAHLAVLNPYEVSDMSNEFYKDDNIIVPATININFGDTPSSSSLWNNVTSQSPYIVGLKDIEGNNTGVIVKFHDAFNGSNGLGAETTTTLMNMPSEVSKSCFWGYSQGNFEGKPLQPTGGFAFIHLNKELAYDFTFYSSRTGCTDNRETLYCLTGADRFKGYLDAANNTDNTVTVSNVLPDDNGVITLSVSPGENNSNIYKFYYINALQINAHPATDGIRNNANNFQEASPNISSSDIYNLQGQHLPSLRKGMNVVDGRRILVK